MQDIDFIVDAHHHLWDLKVCHYPWLMARGVRRFFGDPTPIQKDYLVQDLFNDIGELPVSASVHIQVGVEESQALSETHWLQGVADAATSKGFPQGIVAFCDLSAEDAIERLKAQRRFPNLRGIRQIIGRSPEEDAKSGSHALLENASWINNVSRLAEYDLSFDLQLIPAQLPQAARVFARVPNVKVALCHCGSPFDQSKAGLRSWKAGLKRLAQLPNLHCKLSGFGMFDHHWTTKSIRPLIESVIEIFTPARCLFASNFPVDKLYAEYQAIWRAYDAITMAYSKAERRQMFGENARRFYSL